VNSTITSLLALLTTIVGGITDAATITTVIATLEQIIASGIEEVQAIAPLIQNIIGALKNNTSVTATQMTQLETQEAAIDAALDAAAAADGITVPST
jgi:hypothetical protein